MNLRPPRVRYDGAPSASCGAVCSKRRDLTLKRGQRKELALDASRENLNMAYGLGKGNLNLPLAVRFRSGIARSSGSSSSGIRSPRNRRENKEFSFTSQIISQLKKEASRDF